MINNNPFFYFNKIILEIGWKIVYFPVWWYSKGLVNKLKKAKNFIKNKERALALIIWIKNINKPMYGQHDLTGTLISFFIRLFQIILRSIILFFWVLFQLLLVITWIILPIFVFYQIIFQIL
jgi:hypothetical protein